MCLKPHENKHQVGKSSGMKEQLSSPVSNKACSGEVAPAVSRATLPTVFEQGLGACTH